MTQIVHVANTNVEFEFAHPTTQSLESSLSHHPPCLQLQFLPLLYAQPDDIVAVTALPSQGDLTALQHIEWLSKDLPQLALLQDWKIFQRKECFSWGPSRQVQIWAEARQMIYRLPSWQVACLINSKAFSFRYTSLQEAALLYDEQALLKWLKKIPGPKVLKTCFGLSGMGNWCIDDLPPSPELFIFCRKEWQQKRPIIAEPWLNRLFDFSTQWFIHPNKQIEYIGATRFETDAEGAYQGTLAGPENMLFASFESFLVIHRQYALQALQDVAEMGFFGFIGIDAFLYLDSHHSPHLYPLVEINGRQTMSLVALRIQQKVCPSHILRLSFRREDLSQFSLLPHQLVNAKGKIVHFRKKLTITFITQLTHKECRLKNKSC